MVLSQEKLNTLKIKYLAIPFLSTGLLFIMVTSNIAAKTDVLQNDMSLKPSKETLSTEQTDLKNKPEKLDFNEPLPNIIREIGNQDPSKTHSTATLAYVIIGLCVCLFLAYVIYVILELWVLSRRAWRQRHGESAHEEQPDHLPNSPAQTNTVSTGQTDADPI